MQIFYSLLLAAQTATPVVPPAPASAISADTAQWWRDYAKAVRAIPIGRGRSLSLRCEGKGSPTVIMENGRGNRMLTWRKVQPVLARRYRVCTYNRAGIDGTPLGPMPRDAVAIVSDLEKLIRQAQLRAPYILVGHSLGGLTMRLFARRNLSRTVGIVLVDPSWEDMLARMAPISPGWVDVFRKDSDRLWRCAAQFGAAECEITVPDDAPPSLRDYLIARRPHEWFLTMASEQDSLGREDADSAQIKSAGTDLGAIPMIVLTAPAVNRSGIPEAEQPAAIEAKIAMHNAIARYSRRGVQKIVTSSSHNVHLDRPEAVIEAVDQVASMARR